MAGKSVVRFSPLINILYIASYSVERETLDLSDILKIIVDVRKRIELERVSRPYSRVSLLLAQDERYWKEKYDEHRAKEIFEILKRWGLLENEGNITPKLRKIGEYFNNFLNTNDETKLDLAKTLLLDCMLKSGKDELFYPTRFLLKIRNCSISHIEIEGKNINNQVVKRTVNINEEGIVYASNDFIRKLFDTNPVSFQVLRDWGKFFDLTNWFRLRSRDPEIVKVISPNFGIYLTRYTCTLHEMISIIDYVREKRSISFNELLEHMSQSGMEGFNQYSMYSILHNLEHLGIITEHGNQYKVRVNNVDPFRIVQLGLDKNLLILLDGKQKGVVFEYTNDILQEDYSKILFLCRPDIPLEMFFEKLKQVFYSLLIRPAQNFVYIPELREETCKVLRISDDMFNNKLRECAEKYYEKLEFVRAPQRFGLLKVAKFGEPLVLNGIEFYLIRVTP